MGEVVDLTEDFENWSLPFTPGNHSRDAYDYYYDYDVNLTGLTWAHFVIVKYIFPVLIFLGLCGNALLAIASWKLSSKVSGVLRNTSFVAVLDTLVLLVRCGDFWYRTVFNNSLSDRILASSNVVCKTYLFVFSTVLGMDLWLFVVQSLEVVLLIFLPKAASQATTGRRVKVMNLGLLLLLVCFNAHNFWTTSLVSSGMDGFDLCISNAQSKVFVNNILPWLRLVGEQVLPIGAILVFLLVIRIKVQCGGGWSNLLTSHVQRSRSLLEQCRCLHFMGVFYLLLNLPTFAVDVYTQWFVEIDTLKQAERYNFLALLTRFAFYIWLSCKVLVFLLFSSEFRRILKSMFTCCCCRRSMKGRGEKDELQASLMS